MITLDVRVSSRRHNSLIALGALEKMGKRGTPSQPVHFNSAGMLRN